ncbi:hypothetical protein L195_g062561, partial [Trifolium pratense]
CEEDEEEEKGSEIAEERNMELAVVCVVVFFIHDT